MDFAVPTDHRIKLKEREKKDKYLDLARELKRKTNYGTWRWRLYESWLVFSVENGQNTEKDPGDLRKLAVSQTPVKDHQLTLMLKTLRE